MRIAGAKARLRGNDAADDRARRKAANDGARIVTAVVPITDDRLRLV
jgi:hypothetical protein